uniref:Uncharacterized protein LOC102808821 n=1 Tax=Saccoglossus kowalevskii TaxID=10224 RepID=A0ABM0MUG2_SACKO|nr:PREDICTED: uncharacterized protein LOC102808821 [Saccoglossus kowalevskii]
MFGYGSFEPIPRMPRPDLLQVIEAEEIFRLSLMKERKSIQEWLYSVKVNRLFSKLPHPDMLDCISSFLLDDWIFLRNRFMYENGRDWLASIDIRNPLTTEDLLERTPMFISTRNVSKLSQWINGGASDQRDDNKECIQRRTKLSEEEKATNVILQEILAHLADKVRKVEEQNVPFFTVTDVSKELMTSLQKDFTETIGSKKNDKKGVNKSDKYVKAKEFKSKAAHQCAMPSKLNVNAAVFQTTGNPPEKKNDSNGNSGAKNLSVKNNAKDTRFQATARPFVPKKFPLKSTMSVFSNGNHRPAAAQQGNIAKPVQQRVNSFLNNTRTTNPFLTSSPACNQAPLGNFRPVGSMAPQQNNQQQAGGQLARPVGGWKVGGSQNGQKHQYFQGPQQNNLLQQQVNQYYRLLGLQQKLQSQHHQRQQQMEDPCILAFHPNTVNNDNCSANNPVFSQFAAAVLSNLRNVSQSGNPAIRPPVAMQISANNQHPMANLPPSNITVKNPSQSLLDYPNPNLSKKPPDQLTFKPQQSKQTSNFAMKHSSK